MKINSLPNQNFGKLKITAEGSNKIYRGCFLMDALSFRFDELDIISGKTPVEIRFDKKDFSPYIKGFIKDKEIYGTECYSINDVYDCADTLKYELLNQKSKGNITKFFK